MTYSLDDRRKLSRSCQLKGHPHTMTQRRISFDRPDVWLEPASWVNRRQLERVDLGLPAILNRPNQYRSKVVLADISTHGCRVDAGGLRLGDRVWIHLPTLEAVCAHVAWATPEEAGLEFRQPLHPAVVAHLAGDLRRN